MVHSTRVAEFGAAKRFLSDPKSVISEYFVGFYSIKDTTGEGLFNFLLEDLLPGLNLDVQNIRGQGYDNGANMRGKNVGLQKRLLDVNPRAFFVPCAAHSLNLVVNDAAKSNGEIANFFDIIQELYNFFSASTHRWDILKNTIANFSLKPLSDTRWESRINALRPLQTDLKNILFALNQLSQETKDHTVRVKAKSLSKKISSYKFICSVIIWHDLLERINIVSQILQRSNINLAECVEALKNFKKKLISKRNDESFTIFINRSATLAQEIEVEPEFPEIRERKKPRMFHYESIDENLRDPKQNFKVNFYFQILDIAVNSVGERFDLLENCFSVFSFLLTFHAEDNENLKKSCMDLDIKLQVAKNGKVERDLDGIELYNELLSFRDLFPQISRLKPLDILNHILSQDLTPYFPNLFIALRIFLTLPISVASGERSFSKLKLIKNYLRSTISQERLTNLAIISIESDICEALDISNIIDEFASKKARKCTL